MASCLTCLACNAASCCIGQACNSCSSSMNCKKSIVTRVGYAFQLLIVSIAAWLLSNLSSWTDKPTFLNYIPVLKTCLQTNSNCYGAMAVFRLCFALALYHIILAVILMYVKNTRDPRSGIQDGFWFFKLVALAGLIVAAFFIPNGFFFAYGYIAVIGAGVFIVIQLILLVDFAHGWNESWVAAYEEDGESRTWATLLVGSTVAMYTASAVLTVLLFVFFTKNAGEGCWMNPMFITLNLIFCLTLTFVSIHPTLREKNPKSGILQSAVVTLYCTYMVWSAIMSEPRDMLCGHISSSGGSTYSLIMGMIFTVLAVAYSTIRMSTSSDTFTVKGSDDQTALLSTEPTSIEDSAPALTLEGDEEAIDDEVSSTTYSYSFFHLTFALAAMYITMLLTNWQMISKSTENDQTKFVVDEGMVSVWMKMAASWVTIVIYIWTLVAPVILSDREFV